MNTRGMTRRHLTATDSPRPGFTTRITYRIGPEGPEPQSVEVTGGDGYSVTGQILREVPVAQLIRKAVYDQNQQWTQVDPAEVLRMEIPPEVPEAGRNLARLRAIQGVYEDAAAQGRPPAKAVADALGVSIATAGRRIRESKEQLGWG